MLWRTAAVMLMLRTKCYRYKQNLKFKYDLTSPCSPTAEVHQVVLVSQLQLRQYEINSGLGDVQTMLRCGVGGELSLTWGVAT